jgi:hypothetical protein
LSEKAEGCYLLFYNHVQYNSGTVALPWAFDFHAFGIHAHNTKKPTKPRIEPWIQRLADAGLWFSDDLRIRILPLAGEAKTF